MDWDDSVPKAIEEDWRRWRSELSHLSTKGIPRSYFPEEAAVHSVQLHGFSDACRNAECHPGHPVILLCLQALTSRQSGAGCCQLH